jgi:hypothetical protein
MCAAMCVQARACGLRYVCVRVCMRACSRACMRARAWGVPRITTTVVRMLKPRTATAPPDVANSRWLRLHVSPNLARTYPQQPAATNRTASAQPAVGARSGYPLTAVMSAMSTRMITSENVHDSPIRAARLTGPYLCAHKCACQRTRARARAHKCAPGRVRVRMRACAHSRFSQMTSDGSGACRTTKSIELLQ